MKKYITKVMQLITKLGLFTLISVLANNAFAGEKIGKLICTTDQIAKYSGSGWECAADNDTRLPKPDGPCLSDGVTANPIGVVTPGKGRYFDCNNGTVTDTVTGLIMLKNANCLTLLDVDADGTATWVTANEAAEALGDLPGPAGDCGLEDNSSPGDWRLMTKDEWLAIVKKECMVDDSTTYSPALASRFGLGCYLDDFDEGTQVFDNVVDKEVVSGYWSSTTDPDDPDNAYFTDLDVGEVPGYDKNEKFYVWPVR